MPAKTARSGTRDGARRRPRPACRSWFPCSTRRGACRPCTSASPRWRATSTANTRLKTRGRLCRRRQPRRDQRSRTGAAGDAARRAGRVAVAQFRQGGRAARRPRSRPPRRRAVHGRRRPASADLIETLVSRWLDDGYDVVYTAKAHRENEPQAAPLGVHWFYSLINWGQRQPIPEDAGDFRLLSPRAAEALRQHAGAQPLLQGHVELDRLPPGRASITSRRCARTARRRGTSGP